jgi:anti-sigma regulatory factor (Ser/Thr protein kinase)
VGLALVEGGGRTLSFTASDRDHSHTTDWCEVDAYADVPLNNTVRTGKPITGSLQELAGRYAEFVGRQGSSTCALASVPLVAAGQVMGGFVLFYDAHQPFDASQLSELEGLGAQLGEQLRRSQRARTIANRSLADEPVPDGARVATHLAEAEARAVGGARRFVQETLTDWQVDGDGVDVAVLCVSELVTNVIIHTVAGCEVRLVLQEDVLTISVRDGGPGASRPQQAADDPLAGHGRGLQLVEMLTTRWGSELDADGMTVWCELEVG